MALRWVSLLQGIIWKSQKYPEQAHVPRKGNEGLWLHFCSLPAPHHIHPGDQVLNRAPRVGKRYPVDPRVRADMG